MMIPSGNPTLDDFRSGRLDPESAQRVLAYAKQINPDFALPDAAMPATPPPPRPIAGLAPAAAPAPTQPSQAPRPIAAINRPAQHGLEAPEPTSAAQAPIASASSPAPISGQRQIFNDLTTGENAKAGVNRIHSPWARIPLQILNGIGSAVVPGVMAGIPGTTLHHSLEQHRAAANLNEEEAAETGAANRAHLNAETDELPARAEHEREQAEALKHPKETWEQGTEPEIDPQHPELGAQAVYWNKSDPTQRHYGNAPVAAKPTADKTAPHYVHMPGVGIVAMTPGKDGKIGTELVYKEDPKVESDLTDLEINGKAHKVIVNKQTGAVIRDLGESGVKPATVNVNAGQARDDKSYEAREKELNTLGAPIAQLGQRFGRLKDTIAQGTPQADALIAPELLTVMAGGQGSGLRMNEAEIARIVGGRSKWETLRAAIQQWSTDPKTANSITEEQRQQIRALVQTVDGKLSKKQNALNSAYERLSTAKSPEEHRQIVNETRKIFQGVDNGEGEDGGGGVPPKGATMKVPDKQGKMHWSDGKQDLGLVE